MRKFQSPVFWEGIRVYFTGGHSVRLCALCLSILVLVQVLGILLPSFGSQGWAGLASLFRISFVTALILMVYFGLRLANREFAPESFRTPTDWSRETGVGLNRTCLGQMAVLCVNVLVLVLVCFPALAWAGAIGRARFLSILSAPFFLFFYTVAYGVWGLVTAVLCEESLERRQILIRCLAVSWFVLSAFLYPPLNPVLFSLIHFEPGELGSTRIVEQLTWSAKVNFLSHVVLLTAGFLTYRQILKRRGVLVSR